LQRKTNKEKEIIPAKTSTLKKIFQTKDNFYYSRKDIILIKKYKIQEKAQMCRTYQVLLAELTYVISMKLHIVPHRKT